MEPAYRQAGSDDAEKKDKKRFWIADVAENND